MRFREVALFKRLKSMFCENKLRKECLKNGALRSKEFSLCTCIKNCSIVKQQNKVVIIQLLYKCFRDNKIAPSRLVRVPSAYLHSALVSKGCNFIAPPAFMQQFLIVICTIFSFLARCATSSLSSRHCKKKKSAT